MTLTKKTRPARRQAPHFKSKFITTELARVFSQSDSEDEEFQGFSDQEDKSRGFSKRLKDMKVESEEDSDVDIGFYSDGEEDDDPPPKRSLCVAMRFPIKRLSTPTTQEVPQKRAKKAAAARAPPPPPSRRSSRRPLKQEEEKDLKKGEMQPRVLLSQILKKGEKEPRVLLSQILKEEKRQKQESLSQKLKEEKRLKQETLSQKLKEEKRQKQETLSQKLKEEERQQQEVQSQSLTKRDKNIQENKAMLAKLFSELSTMAELTPLNTPQKKPTAEKTTPRKRRFEAEAGSERRNPSRKARPPENFGVEERSVSPSRGPRTVDIRRLVEVDEERMDGGGRKKRKSCVRSPHSRRSKYVVKSVDDITKEDLDNIAYRAKDKIWDKENGSSCHQCRQKTLDTKTVCRSGFCNAGKGQFCGPCLKNRYGEDVGTVLLDPTWSCPICRNVCNCSLCRKKEGRCATGILVGLARFNGHDNVHEYLERIQKELS